MKLSSLILLTAATLAAADTNHLLWYTEPANEWVEALPIGNGRLGAMVFGGVSEDHLQLNEDTLWAGEPRQMGQPKIAPTFEKVVWWLRNGEYQRVEEYITKNWLGIHTHPYQTLGDLKLRLGDVAGEVTDYRRELDLDRAVVTVSYTEGGVRYTREYFSSHPEQVIALRLTADKPGRISFSAGLSSPHPTARQTRVDGTTVVMEGQAPGIASERTFEQLISFGDQHKYPEFFDTEGNLKPGVERAMYGERVGGRGMFFEARLRALADGGEVTSDEKGLHVREANSVTLLLSAATSYNGWRKSPSRDGVDPAARSIRNLERAAKCAYDNLLKTHVEDYQELFRRVHLDLGPPTEQSSLPTVERIAALEDGEDPEMIELLFHFGRYLLIASSRQGAQPATLQGIWNREVLPAWNCQWTADMNVQMSYWSADVVNLGECAEPLLQLVEDLSVNGRITARESFGLPGWCSGLNADLWRYTDPYDRAARYSIWMFGGAWLCQHVWDHYLFTKDEDYLRGRAYPVLKGAAEFLAAWLVEDEHGRLLTPVSTSPENSFYYEEGKRAAVSMGSTMDMAITREVFENVISASKTLGVDTEFRQHLENLLPRLLPYQVGRLGQLQEWYKDWDKTDDHHRHLSHLYPVYPGVTIAPRSTPKLAAAAVKALEIRAADTVGFSKAWSINLWARLGYPERAYSFVRSLAARNPSPNLLFKTYDTHAWPITLDANFAFPGAVAEMLLQSQYGEIEFLPALPEAWRDGHIRGLRARGGLEVDIEWKDGRALRAELKAHADGEHRLRAPAGQRIDRSTVVRLEAGESYEVTFQ